MKKGMVFLTIVFLVAALAVPASGAEQLTPRTGTPKQIQPLLQVPKEVKAKSDLVVSIISHGSVYRLGERQGISEYATNIEFTITNKGRVATGRAGSIFSVGADYAPLCQFPECSQQVFIGMQCNLIREKVTQSIHFLHPIIIDKPLSADETRTVMATLVLPQCLIYSTLGGTVSVSLIVDDMNQVDESNETNNKSAPISVTSHR